MNKILIVDDMPAWREFHKTNIEELFIELSINDYVIDTANNAREGVDRLYENTTSPYNLIITDLQMEEDFTPKYAGEWFVEQIKNLNSYKNTSVIISSGCYNIRQIAESYNVDFVPKRIACTDKEKYENIIKKGLKWKN